MSESHVRQQSVLIDVEPLSAESVQAKMPVDKTIRRYEQDQPMPLAPDLRGLAGCRSSGAALIAVTTSLIC